MSEKRTAWSANIVNVSMLSYMIWLLLPSVQAFTHAVTGVFTIALFGVGVLLDGVTLRRDWRTFIPRVLLCAALPLILILFLDRGGDAKAGYYVQQCMFWFPLIWCAYARMHNDQRMMRGVFHVFFAAFLVTLLTTAFWLILYFLTDDPSFPYARLLGNDFAYLYDERITAMLRNIGGYNFIYMSVLLLPVIAYEVIRSHGWRRMMMIISYVLILLVTVLSMYTIAIVLAFSITAVELLAALLRKAMKKLSVTLSFVCVLPLFVLLLIFRLPLVELALQIATHFKLTSISFNLQSMIGVLSGDIASSSRFALYKVSIDAFLSSPWLGSIVQSEITIGKHSELLDLLAGIGILGTAGFIGGAWVIGRKTAAGIFRISKKTQPHLWLQWLVFFILFSINTVFYSREIPLVLCISILYFLQSNNKLPENSSLEAHSVTPK